MIATALTLSVIRLQRATLAALLVLFLANCSSRPVQPGNHESLNATLWSLTSPEFAASTTQAYRVAADNLDLALADSHWTAALEQQGNYGSLPPAVLMDIDQTVLDNSRYNAQIITQYGEYSQETFSQWCEQTAATAIPGAKEFVDHAVESGVTVIYYSRRIEALRDCTTRNMEALGFALPEQKYLILNNKLPATTKAQLRTELSSQFRILLLVGDDLEDFVTGSRTDPVARRALFTRHADRWGRQWIILPNPMYGAWDTSLHRHDYGLSREERLDLKLEYLAE
jgi:5'-nucleotidase (lipoprotein e(P4) family)